MSLGEGASLALGCRQFYRSIDQEVICVPLLEDNRTAIEFIAHGGPIHARTRYIGVKLYFVKDHVDSGELEVVYCPTADMLADVMTKPVVGSQFVSLRDRIVFIVPKLG